MLFILGLMNCSVKGGGFFSHEDYVLDPWIQEESMGVQIKTGHVLHFFLSKNNVRWSWVQGRNPVKFGVEGGWVMGPGYGTEI